MERYTKFKESGIPWVPALPIHWERIKLKALVAAKITDGPHETPEFIEEGIPFLSAEAIKIDKLDFTARRGYISLEQHEVYAQKSSVKKNDILFCKSGSTTGKSALVETDEVFGIWSPLAIIRANNAITYYKYLFYCIQSYPFREQVENFWSFGTQPNIGMGALENLWVSVPPLKEQYSIARLLDEKTAQIDQLITQKQQMLVLLQEERAALINHAVTKGLDAAAPVRDSGIEWLGEVPAHWEVKRMKWIAEIQGGLPLSSGKTLTNPVTLPYLRVANVQDGYLDLEEIKMVEVEEEQIGRYSLRKGDLLMNEGGDNDKLGRGCVWQGEIEPCLHQNHVFAVRLFDGYSPEWLNLITTTEGARIHFMTRAKQSTNLASISSTNIKELPVLLPPEHEQHEILDFVTKEGARITELTNTINQEITLLQEYRAALIAEAVTGQIDVRNYEPASILTAELVG